MPDVPDNLVALAQTQLAFIDLQRGQQRGRGRDREADARRSATSRTRRPSTSPLEALKKEKKYPEAIALLEPLVEKFDSDPFVNARYVETAGARRREGQGAPARRRRR